MISLFLDTSSSNLNVGVLKDKKLLKEKYIHFEKDLSKYALNEIKELLDSLSLKPNDIDNIYCVNGPGSFTGLRIGVTIAKTFAWGLNKNLYKLSSLFVMANSVFNSDYIIPLIDARRGYVFTGVYDNQLNCIMNDDYIELDDLLEKIEAGKSVTYISLDNFDLKTNLPEYNVNKIVEKHYDDTPVNPHSLNPNYLKKTEAEEKRENTND